jgi:hypothetical protein
MWATTALCITASFGLWKGNVWAKDIAEHGCQLNAPKFQFKCSFTRARAHQSFERDLQASVFVFSRRPVDV